MVSQACYSTSDGRRYSRPYPLYFPSPPERRFPLSSHDTRATLAMADQLDSDSTPQRKRIAVACGRCRKRKIRCSGDPGQGQPCSNCKNAGVDQCQFLRVASREAPMRPETSDFDYSVGDARIYASRTPVGGGMPYTHELPTLGSLSEVPGSYRGGGSTYASSYTPASKAYYPAMHAYGTPYGDEFEFGLGVPSPSVLHQEPVGLLPGQWGPSGAARASKPPSFSGNMYMDADGAYSTYGGASLLHRPPPSVSSDSPSFSLSGVAASLPLSSTPGPDRLLPYPAGRSATLPYSANPLKSSATPSCSNASAASTLADVATAATYAGGFETPGLSYSSTASSSLSSHPPSSSRANSDTYSSASESIFGEQERSLQSQGPEFDMSSYTASPRRGSAAAAAAAAAGTEGTTQSHHHAAPGPPPPAPHPAHHHGLPSSGGYIGGAAAPSSPLAHRLGHGGQSVVASGSGSLADDRQTAAVGNRH